ncbi:MAG: transcription termination factor Rho [Desertimonas sp.]
MAAEALEQSVLESKDKEQLLAIAKALGLKASSRTKKSDIITLILETTGHAADATAPDASDATPAAAGSTSPEQPAAEPKGAGPRGAEGRRGVGGSVDADPTEDRSESASAPAAAARPAAGGGTTDRAEPLAEWELDLDVGERPESPPVTRPNGSGLDAGASNDGADGESRSRRRRRRRKGNRGSDGEDPGTAANANTGGTATADGPDGGGELAANEQPLPVSGYLDLRDEGYGFLRVRGYLPSRDDAYVPVKLARQLGLRKGDHIEGSSRSAGRNEKNPALLEVTTVNGKEPGEARRRPRFDDLTALYPDQRLRLEDPSDPTNMTGRIIDLVSPIGKGQRGLIVSPPKAGKTMIMKTIAQKIEKNHPEVTLIILLVDERPEEVTDLRRSVHGEVVASTFDRPSEEHTHVAELVIEKAKRLVEQGQDVVVILDGITRLARAYNLAAPAGGKLLSGGIDAAALYPPKQFFGAARNVEEGGSLTILATALVDTNSRMDEAIFEEFKGTGNMEVRLDRRLAERRIFPAIDVDASSTRHEELLFDRQQLQMAWKLRRVLSGLAADGNPAAGLEMLMDRLKSFRTNDEFLAELAKQST